jgi:hypothetical protein
MEGTIGLPRDLFAGVLAGELMDKGYFGQESQYFGCVYRQYSSNQYMISRDENKIYNAAARLFYEGIVISPVFSFSKRWDAAQNPVEADKHMTIEIKRQLAHDFPENLLDLLTGLSEITDKNTASILLKSYMASLSIDSDPLKKQGLLGLIKKARVSKILDARGAQQLINSFAGYDMPDNIEGPGCNFSGIAYLDESRCWRLYVNAYMPAVITKKIKIAQNRRNTTPMFTYSYPFNNDCYHNINKIRGEFEETLRQVFDKDYLDVVEQLDSLPSAINESIWKSKLMDIEKDLQPLAKAALNGYMYLWHLQP